MFKGSLTGKSQNCCCPARRLKLVALSGSDLTRSVLRSVPGREIR